MHPSPPGQRWVTFAEAVTILRTTDPTLRRWIRLGHVIAEPLPRDPNSPASARITYRVLVADDPPPPATDTESAQPPVISHEPPPDVASAITAATTPLVERLAIADERIAALDERNERQAGMMVEQAERIGKLSAKLDAATAEAAELRARLARPWWRRFFG
jgi:hypothetical protein